MSPSLTVTTAVAQSMKHWPNLWNSPVASLLSNSLIKTSIETKTEALHKSSKHKHYASDKNLEDSMTKAISDLHEVFRSKFLIVLYDLQRITFNAVGFLVPFTQT